MSSSGPIEALVVGSVTYGEADRIVHLLTSQGRLSVFAHNAKKSRRRFGGALEPFTTLQADLGRTQRASGLASLSSVVGLKARLGLRKDLNAIALASYICELSYEVAPEGQESLIKTICEQALDTLEEQGATEALRRAFELHLLCEQGYQPQLDQCVSCGSQEGADFIDLSRGGLFCPIHRQAAKEIGPKTKQWLQAVVAEPDNLLPEAFPADWADRAARALGGPLSECYRELLQRPLKAIRMLQEVGL